MLYGYMQLRYFYTRFDETWQQLNPRVSKKRRGGGGSGNRVGRCKTLDAGAVCTLYLYGIWYLVEL